MQSFMHLLLGSMLLTAGIAQPRPRSVRDIRQIDFKNFAYRTAGEDMRVSRGRGSYRGDGDEVFTYKVERVDVTYGDLTSDRKAEAAVTLHYSGGGTGAFSKGFVFTIRRGRLTLLAAFEGGDRADGGIREVSIRDGLLRVQRNEPERMNNVPVGLCCPLYLITTMYRWDGNRLAQVGEVQKVEVN
jgi:hypothetical protein